jgi:hypothetical protein
LEEHHHIGILLNRSRPAQISQGWSLALPCFNVQPRLVIHATLERRNILEAVVAC